MSDNARILSEKRVCFGGGRGSSGSTPAQQEEPSLLRCRHVAPVCNRRGSGPVHCTAELCLGCSSEASIVLGARHWTNAVRRPSGGDCRFHLHVPVRWNSLDSRYEAVPLHHAWSSYRDAAKVGVR